MDKNMRIAASALAVELTPDKAQYRPGEPAVIRVEAKFDAERLPFRWSVCELHRILLEGEGELRKERDGVLAAELRIPAFDKASGAYGVFVSVGDEGNGGVQVSAETAYDVAAHWREAPRYGFLSDFPPDDRDDGDVAFLNRHHLNVVQFYDWMYRHDRLLTDEEPFTDPLGRTVSLDVVRRKIAALKARGIASLAYAAVYASLPDYARAHPEQVLYQNDGVPYRLGNFFYIMDISPGSAWTEHITDQFAAAVAWGFDGLHLDQYGFPKQAIRKTDGGAEVVRLKELYPAIINRSREKTPDAGLIFNNVGSYPLHTTAAAAQDALYIEVWDPVTRLYDLYALVRRARALTAKPVILAAYLPAFHPERPVDPEAAEAGATVAMAAIFASGAYHLLLGERGGVLADPYYPKYGTASPAFQRRLTAYYDFIVLYRDLLFDPTIDDWTESFTGGINNELVFRKEGVAFSTDARLGTIWTLAREKPGFQVIHLLNLIGLDNDVWHAPKAQPPQPLEEIVIELEVVEDIEGVYAATPDGGSIRPQPLAYEWIPTEWSGRKIRFILPKLDYWSVVYVKSRAGVPAGTFDPAVYPGKR
ncbi:MAG TPA: glycoside hydrolase family 66 protein [Bacilli bacterium]